MPPARIHEAIAKEVNKDKNYDELLLRIGTVAPDCWRNVPPDGGVKDKYKTHFWDFSVKEGQANDYKKFFLKYYEHLDNPFYFGYLVHLIADQYWKTYIDPKYEIEDHGIKGFRLKDGSFHSDEDWFGYRDALKMQRQLAKKYDLGILPINREDYDNFECNIEELNLNGLFGDSGTLSYINSHLVPGDEVEETLVYDVNDIINYVKETANIVNEELDKLYELKRENKR